MTLPRLTEVVIHVADLDAALSAWHRSFGLDAARGAGEATIEVGGVSLRFVQDKKASAGLFGLALAVSGAGESIEPAQSHGVPIRFIDGSIPESNGQASCKRQCDSA